MNNRKPNHDDQGAKLSKWPGKYVIGLTGNIATGKSVVRKMLEHLGAYGIDADALAHRAISKDAPGYQPVIDMFGRWILNADQQIDRVRLGRVVFSDPDALFTLEKIVHPLVAQAVDIIVRRSRQPIIVIEAIKLIEANLYKSCDSLWVSYASGEVQLARLTVNRRMGLEEARRRIASQPPQENKIAAANILIKNGGSFGDTWRQVSLAWQKTVPAAAEQLAPVRAATSAKGELTIERGRPSHSKEIATLVTQLARDHRTRTADDIMAAFGEKAFLLLRLDHKLVGVVGWQVENLVSRTTDIYIEPSIPISEALPPLLSEIERASKDLQCEASLIFATPDLMQNDSLWKKLSYELRKPETLSVQAWQEAAIESLVPDTTLFFKQLRQDRVLRPI
jgi:dephospho-CoA kinase